MGPLLPLIRACQIPTFDRDPLTPVERTSRGLTDRDFLFWVVSPADSLGSVKRERLFELLDDLGFIGTWKAPISLTWDKAEEVYGLTRYTPL